MAEVKATALVGGVSFERSTSFADARTHLADPDSLVWIDVQDPGDAEINTLIELFGFHPLALEDVTKGRQRPKVDEYKGYLFAVTYVLARGQPHAREFRSVELDLFIGKNFLVTLHHGPLALIDEAQHRWGRGGALLREGVGFLVYAVFDTVVDGYLPVVDDLERAIDGAEAAMIEGAAKQQVEDLLDLRRSVLRLRRLLHPMREAFAQLVRRDRPFLSPAVQIYFQDVHDHLMRVIDLVDAQRDMANSLLEASLTIASNRLNTTMRRLTTISVVAGFASAVFGAWGMNFAEVPIAASPYGFPLVVGGTIVVLMGLLAFGRSRGWL